MKVRPILITKRSKSFRQSLLNGIRRNNKSGLSNGAAMPYGQTGRVRRKFCAFFGRLSQLAEKKFRIPICLKYVGINIGKKKQFRWNSQNNDELIFAKPPPRRIRRFYNPDSKLAKPLRNWNKPLNPIKNRIRNAFRAKTEIELKKNQDRREEKFGAEGVDNSRLVLIKKSAKIFLHCSRILCFDDSRTKRFWNDKLNAIFSNVAFRISSSGRRQNSR